MPGSAPAIEEIKDAILKRARARQAAIECGDYAVPLHYKPLPLPELLDLLGQWEYRRDSLALAVPPASPGLAARLGRLCKSLVAKSLRWLLIRQVEFNTAAIRHAQALAEFFAAVDRNQAEFLAAFNALKLQVHALAGRLAELEHQSLAAGQIDTDFQPCPQADTDHLRKYQVYLAMLVARESKLPSTEGKAAVANESRKPGKHGSILVLGSGQGDFLRFLISEGVAAQGIERDAGLVEDCRERELPVIQTDFLSYLSGVEDGSVAGIVLDLSRCDMPAQELAALMGRCWSKLRKGAVLIVEADNPEASSPRAVDTPRMPVDLLAFLLESQCFTLIDSMFSAPAQLTNSPLVRTSSDRPFDLRQYGRYAVTGRR
jgi:Methionine biosynthesis protein MetW